MGLARLEVLFFFAIVQELCVLADSRFTGSSPHASCTRGVSSSSSETAIRSGRTRGISSSSSSSSRVRAGYVENFLRWSKSYMVSSSEQFAHAILAGTQDSSNRAQYLPLWSIQLEKRQVKSWMFNFGHTQSLHLRQGEKDRDAARLKHVNSGRTWTRCRELNNTTFPPSFCLRVGIHKGLIAWAKFCRNATIQCIVLEPGGLLFGLMGRDQS